MWGEGIFFGNRGQTVTENKHSETNTSHSISDQKSMESGDKEIFHCKPKKLTAYSLTNSGSKELVGL